MVYIDVVRDLSRKTAAIIVGEFRDKVGLRKITIYVSIMSSK